MSLRDSNTSTRTKRHRVNENRSAQHPVTPITSTTNSSIGRTKRSSTTRLVWASCPDSSVLARNMLHTGSCANAALLTYCPDYLLYNLLRTSRIKQGEGRVWEFVRELLSHLICYTARFVHSPGFGYPPLLIHTYLWTFDRDGPARQGRASPSGTGPQVRRTVRGRLPLCSSSTSRPVDPSPRRSGCRTSWIRSCWTRSLMRPCRPRSRDTPDHVTTSKPREIPSIFLLIINLMSHIVRRGDGWYRVQMHSHVPHWCLWHFGNCKGPRTAAYLVLEKEKTPIRN